MKKGEILVLTSDEEAVLERVLIYLKEMGESFYRFNTETFPREARLTLLFSKGRRLRGFLRASDGSMIDLGKIKSVWYRRPGVPRVDSGLPDGYARFAEEECRACLWSLYTTLDSFWMNPPLTGYRLLEHNKLHQLRAAASVGLRVPPTIITNDPVELKAFFERQKGSIIIKTVASHFFRDQDGETVLIYSNKPSREKFLRHLGGVKFAPVMAQKYIPKKFELRVTIVGSKTFACAIYSQDSERTRHDWRRYDFERVKHEPYQLPAKIEEKLLRLMKRWGLSFGAIDMILTPRNEYFFLEINPQGQWGWIETLTGLPISEAIARTLADPTS